MNIRIPHLLVAALLCCLPSVLSSSVAASTVAAKYAVVTNSANSVNFDGEEAARQEVAKIFLRTLDSWSNKEEAKPYTPKSGDDAHAAYLTSVLQMTEAELARHWISMKNKSGIAPPKEVSSESMMKKYVGRSDGGLGILPIEDAESAEDLKVLMTF